VSDLNPSIARRVIPSETERSHDAVLHKHTPDAIVIGLFLLLVVLNG
jgi:hypothetical protein